MSCFTLDATLSGTAANTYIATAAEMRTVRTALSATAAGLGLDFAAFDAATDDQLVDAAVLAVGSLDTQNFPGFKKAANQARAWPRVSVRRADAENVIPVGLKFAQVAEMAAMVTAQSDASLSAAAGVVSWTAGKKSVAYDADLLRLQKSSRIADSTRRVLSMFGLVAGSVSTVYQPRG